MKKLKPFFIFLLGALSVLTISNTYSFPDVNPGDWFHQYVEAIKDWGIVKGQGDGTFAPDKNINRAEFSKMLYLYDQRVDEKIAAIETSGALPSTETTNLPSIMYLDRWGEEPSACPGGWNQVSIGTRSNIDKRNIYRRICTTNNYCQVLSIKKYREEPEACPSGWTESDYSATWLDGNDQERVRTCHICQ